MSKNKSSLARIKIKFPKQIWISELFEKYKDIRMEIISFLPYDLEEFIGNSIIEIKYFDIDSVLKEIEDHPSIVEMSVLEKEENRVRFNVKTKDPFLLYAIIKCGVLVSFPVNVRDGFAYWKLISTRERIDKLLSIFEEKGINFELLRIGNAPYALDDSSKLSYEEIHTLEKAIDLGFFDIPRKISLEDFAKRLGKSKSSLSVMLRKIVKKKIII